MANMNTTNPKNNDELPEYDIEYNDGSVEMLGKILFVLGIVLFSILGYIVYGISSK